MKIFVLGFRFYSYNEKWPLGDMQRNIVLRAFSLAMQKNMYFAIPL